MSCGMRNSRSAGRIKLSGGGCQSNQSQVLFTCTNEKRRSSPRIFRHVRSHSSSACAVHSTWRMALVIDEKSSTCYLSCVMCIKLKLGSRVSEFTSNRPVNFQNRPANLLTNGPTSCMERSM